MLAGWPRSSIPPFWPAQSLEHENDRLAASNRALAGENIALREQIAASRPEPGQSTSGASASGGDSRSLLKVGMTLGEADAALGSHPRQNWQDADGRTVYKWFRSETVPVGDHVEHPAIATYIAYFRNGRLTQFQVSRDIEPDHG